jgi:hypothetical protein
MSRHVNEFSIFSMGALLELNDVDCPKNVAQGDSIFDYLVNDNGQWGNNTNLGEIDGKDYLYFRTLVNSC